LSVLPGPERLDRATAAYRAYETGDRDAIDALLADDFVFYSPADVGIDREAYFERCWPNAELIESFELVRMMDVGGEVIVTYVATRADGTRFRNTEVMTFVGDRIARVEVYFGWDVE
jgi:ketosteroid isomerase-like protein